MQEKEFNDLYESMMKTDPKAEKAAYDWLKAQVQYGNKHARLLYSMLLLSTELMNRANVVVKSVQPNLGGAKH